MAVTIKKIDNESILPHLRIATCFFLLLPYSCPLIKVTMSLYMLAISLILPSLTSSSRIGLGIAYLIPVRALNLPRGLLIFVSDP